MSEESEILRSYAGHFAYTEGWQWTRTTDIRHIRYQGDWSGYDNPLRRIPRALSLAFRKPKWMRDPHWSPSSWLWGVWAGLVVGLRTEKHLPDGWIKQAGIICMWEEDGEYLQQVQPSIGLLLADFLDSDPEHPSAKAISAELARINADYNQRAEANGGWA